MAGHPPASGPAAALRISITGTVQGVGFRPFVKRFADERGLTGAVRNTPWGVEVLVEGASPALDAFVADLPGRAPRLARIESLEAEPTPPEGRSDFAIEGSAGGPGRTLVAPDVATCPACAAEIADPGDRRHAYPFTTCIDCGPRYSIITSLPYDRPRTTMVGFTMCPACRAEYDDPETRRFHAQPNACPACGPTLRYVPIRPAGAEEGDDCAAPEDASPAEPGGGSAWGDAALEAAVRLLEDGGILALKGLGGFHLACDALRAEAVATLRERKGRDEKPFAIMAPDLATVRRYCAVSPTEADLLAGPEAPILILDRHTGDAAERLPEVVAPGVDTYGFFLPYTPLHHLLLGRLGRPLVMTSGNLSDEPIAFADDDAFARLSRLVDGFLTHDRPIHARVDDSVARIFRGAPYPLRRSRGYAPRPIALPAAGEPLLALGAHQKNTFCLAADGRAYLSPHVGDLDDLATLRALEREVDHYLGVFSYEPCGLVCDLHPDYGSTRYAERLAETRGLPLLRVQHHEAHIASIAAEHQFDGTLVGVAFDGAGYGRDGTIWGGEFLVGDAKGYERVAHLEQLPLPGGERAVKEPWRMALALLLHRLEHDQSASAGGPTEPDDDVAAEIAARLGSLPAGDRWSGLPWRNLLPVIRRGLGAPPTSSVGRLFDGVAALLGIRQRVSYEGQAAILLETAARDRLRRTGLPAPADAPAGWRPPTGGPSLGLAPLVDPVLTEIAAGVAIDEIAARFHHRLAWWAAAVAARLAEEAGTETVALGGGVFQNLLLLELTVARLEHLGLRPLWHRLVPTNDGGVSLGQAALGARILSPECDS